MKYIELTNCRFAMVDDEDFGYLNQWRWSARKIKNTWYAVRQVWIPGWGKGLTILMHREIVHAVKGENVDHIDRNGLNNQKKNLRKCSQINNLANSSIRSNNKSGYKGVSWNKGMKKWCAQIESRGDHRIIGYFDNPRTAALAYDTELFKLFPEFAATNQKLGKIN